MDKSELIDQFANILNIRQGTAEELVNGWIGVIMGEIKPPMRMCNVCPSKECGKCWAKKELEKPQLIQGYTTENWQEIIDGGYLCEFACEGGFCIDQLCSLERIIDGEVDLKFRSKRLRLLTIECRPAQIKGVMMPIFVEPVGKDAGYVFFDRRGSYLGTSNFFTGATWNETIGCCMSSDCTPTKYIEL